MQWLRLYLLSIVPLLEVALLWKYPFILFALLLAIAVFALWGRGKNDFAIFLFAAFWGSVLEIAGLVFGVGSYANAQFWGLPLWIPVLWGITALFVKEVTEARPRRK
ncbi:MAG: DUF2878 family protein [Nanoarchaeota archaeon]|nr:DUF2878 family protein [Nanoarchaeota archaeon]